MERSKQNHHVKRQCGRIAQAIAVGDRKQEEFHKRCLLRSFSAKQQAAEIAKGTCKRQTSLSVGLLARATDLWEPCDELVHLTANVTNTRSDGSARFILDFGPAHQTAQLLIKAAIYHPSHLAPEQTMTQGGAPEAIRRIQSAYADGYTYVSELDIRKCYSSFDSREAGRLLLLPESVIENYLTLEHTNLALSYTCMREQIYHDENSQHSPERLFAGLYGEDFSCAQQGLIEGSRVSPFIVEMLLAPVCRALQARGLGQVVNYADNFLLMARSRDALVTLENILRDELRDHPVGALTVRDCMRDYVPGYSFDFLGYRLEPNGSRLTALLGRKSEKKLREIRRKGYRELNSDMPLARKRRVFRALEKEHKATLRALSCFLGGRDYHNSKMEPLRRLSVS